MRVIPQNVLTGLSGSLPDGHMEFTCWYNGAPVITDIPFSTWSMSFNASQQINGSTSLRVMDESGKLAPWGVDEPLGVGGSILQARLILGPDSVPMGWQRITQSEPTEMWRRAKNGVWVSGGGQIDVTAEDLTVLVSDDKFITPESPLVGNTVQQEIRRLLQGTMNVTFEADIEDRAVPTSLTYREGRLDAVEDLVEALDCKYRVTGTGQMSVYKPNKTSVWTVSADAVTGNLMTVSRSQSITGLKNLIVARNTLGGGKELQAVSEERSGPLRVGGPHGRHPELIQADFAETEWDIQRAADAALDAYLKNRVVTVPLTTSFHPGVELGDWITVMCPVDVGAEIPLPGRVSSINFGGTRLPVSMDIEMEADLYTVQAISEAIRGRRWATNG